jgi:hypothetical protein
MMTYDPAYMNTAACKSRICYIDGDKGILRYRGYPIEQLAEKSSYLEVAYLILYGELPTKEQLTYWENRIMRHTFIHEMTHVWQYYHGYWVVSRSGWAYSWFGAGTDYTVEASDAWDDFNVEQQAHLVEVWFARGSSPTDDRFVFIEKIIRAGVTGGFWADMLDVLLIRMPLDKLRRFSA